EGELVEVHLEVDATAAVAVDVDRQLGAQASAERHDRERERDQRHPGPAPAVPTVSDHRSSVDHGAPPLHRWSATSQQPTRLQSFPLNTSTGRRAVGLPVVAGLTRTAAWARTCPSIRATSTAASRPTTQHTTPGSVPACSTPRPWTCSGPSKVG